MSLTVRELLLGAGLSSAFVAGLIAIKAIARRNEGVRNVPVVTLICFVVISSFSFLQLFIAPTLLPLLMRDSAQVYAGQPWRLVTSLLVQDGGLTGAAFNLVGLLAIGTVAERLLGRLQWVAIAMISVAGAQLVALSWEPIGAGNSILNCGLAGGICAFCLIVRPTRHQLLPAIVASTCLTTLVIGHDIHGIAAVTGALIGVYFLLSKRNNDAAEFDN